jgi:hypothetical protein
MRLLAILFVFVSNVYTSSCYAQYTDIDIDKQITQVQPMTGIVLWTTTSHNKTDAISLEYSYMLFNDIVDEYGNYNWKVVEDKLNAVAQRKHQAIFRFRYVYPGYKTSVPDYIKKISDYKETEGKSEGLTTWFPDWTHSELQKFTLEFYTKFAEKYDSDPRLAFVQVGFGLWAEYHIYDGPFILGKTFPSKEFQTTFFEHLDTTFINTPYSISIDAADDTYSPFSQNENIKNTEFGLFDDSFMHKNHSGYNTECWDFFNRDRYKYAPAGGEFSYYTDYDQEHVLDPNGNFGESYESFAARFHISYMIGNDQPAYQTMDRIKEASMASGYKFKMVSCKVSNDSTIITFKNIGIAPLYYDAYPTINNIKSKESLKLLQPGEAKIFTIPSGGNLSPDIIIESDRLVPGQVIQYEGTVDYLDVKNNIAQNNIKVYPTVVINSINIENTKTNSCLNIFNLSGENVLSVNNISNNSIDISNLNQGMYIVVISSNNKKIYSTKIVVK